MNEPNAEDLDRLRLRQQSPVLPGASLFRQVPPGATRPSIGCPAGDVEIDLRGC